MPWLYASAYSSALYAIAYIFPGMLMAPPPVRRGDGTRSEPVAPYPAPSATATL